MSDTTQPLTDAELTPELWRVSAFQRAMGDLAKMEEHGHASPPLSSISPSLMQELERFDLSPGGAEVVEVVAACLRHGQNVALHLARDGFVVPITLFPREHLYHTPLPTEALLGEGLRQLKLLQVEPAVLKPPGNRKNDLVGETRMYHPLAPLLWSLTMHGPRSQLLPEIAGPAVYRGAPGLDVRAYPMRPPLAQALYRLRGESVPLRAIAAWPGMDEESATRLLNAMYLQSGLIVSRTHPSALSATTLAQSWRQLIRRKKDL